MPSIGVLEHYQSATDKPTKRVKRSDGQSQVRRGVAVWIVKNVLLKLLEPTKRALKDSQALKAKKPITYQHHIEPRLCRISRREMEELERYQLLTQCT